MRKMYLSAEKMFLSLALCLALLMPLFAVQAQAAQTGATTGSWTIASKNYNAALPKSAQKVFNKAMKNITGVDYEPIAYIGKQVVAGTNYYYLCKSTVVVPNAKPSLCIVTIYRNLKGKLSFSDAKKVKLSSLAKNKNKAYVQDGGITVYKKTAAAKLPSSVKKAYNRATKGLTGMSYTPIAYLGSQVVSGSNYSILCLGTSVTKNPVTRMYIMTIYDQSWTKTSEITSIYTLY